MTIATVMTITIARTEVIWQKAEWLSSFVFVRWKHRADSLATKF